MHHIFKLDYSVSSNSCVEKLYFVRVYPGKLFGHNGEVCGRRRAQLKKSKQKSDSELGVLFWRGEVAAGHRGVLQPVKKGRRKGWNKFGGFSLGREKRSRSAVSGERDFTQLVGVEGFHLSRSYKKSHILK